MNSITRRAVLAAGTTAALAGLSPEAFGIGRTAEPVYCNLVGTGSQESATKLLRRAGIWSRRVEVLLAHVRQYNQSVPRSELALTYRPLSQRPTYDPYALQDSWDARHPTFPGYNCRITAFSLMDGLMRFRHNSPVEWDDLFLDREAMQADRSTVVTTGQEHRFARLYTPVPTVKSTDSLKHAAILQTKWRARGIGFVPSSRVRLVSVVQHNNFDGDELFVGHTGLLLPHNDGLWFLEKLAFQEPYQLTRYANRGQLCDELKRRYDLDTTGRTAPNFVMENNTLMKGYRVPRR